MALIANNNPLNTKLSRLSCQFLPSAVSNERCDAKALGVAAHDVERLNTYRACRT
jgi:hypothetical protein